MVRSAKSVAIGLIAVLSIGWAVTTASAQSGIAGKVTYTGSLGPIGSDRPLCLCLYNDANLESSAGCVVFFTNGVSYSVATFNTNIYYMIAFVDLDLNEQPTLNEPQQIFNHRSQPPGDPVVAGTSTTGIDFDFGDESIGLPSPTPSPNPSPTSTPSVSVCAGDCDGNGEVTIDEIVTMLNIALGNVPLSACANGDRDDSGDIDISEIIQAVNHAANGC